MFTEPQPGVFNFTEGEVVASLAEGMGKMLRCHALVWHNQLAPWVENATAPLSADDLRAAIKRHIAGVVGHWKGRCYAWDVVNEALDEDGTYRQSVFYRTLGDEYIRVAFAAAAAADPQARLYYNDYGIERPASNKTEGARRIVKMLKEAGVRIDGLGMQAHLHAETHPTYDEHVAALESFAQLGVEVAFTELDVRIQMPVNDTNLQQQKEGYQNVSSLRQRAPPPLSLSLSNTHPRTDASMHTHTNGGSQKKGCPRLRPRQGLRRHHTLGLLRPLQLGPRHLPRPGRRPALVRRLYQAPGLRRHHRHVQEHNQRFRPRSRARTTPALIPGDEQLIRRSQAVPPSPVLRCTAHQ